MSVISNGIIGDETGIVNTAFLKTEARLTDQYPVVADWHIAGASPEISGKSSSKTLRETKNNIDNIIV